MSQHVKHSEKPAGPTRPNARFFLGVILAFLLILAGVWALWNWSRVSPEAPLVSDQFTSQVTQIEAAPNFSLQTLDGRTVELSDYQGQVVLLNTWATWCPPCRAEMPDLEAYYRERQADGFVVLAVNSQESAGTVAAFLEDHDFTFPVLLDTDGVVMRQYGIRGLPTSFFIDRDGNVHGVWSGQLSPARLRELVDPIL